MNQYQAAAQRLTPEDSKVFMRLHLAPSAYRLMVDSDEWDLGVMRTFSEPPIAGDTWLHSVRASEGMDQNERDRFVFGR